MVNTGGLQFSQDVAIASWVADRLTGPMGSVTGTVPAGFAAYARLCHPVPDSSGGRVSWRAVAAATGRTAHPLMQWHGLVGSPDPFNFSGSLWPAGAPTRGNLPVHALRVLCDVLARHTGRPDDCAFCLWVGYGALHGAVVRLTATPESGARPRAEKVPPPVAPQVLAGPQVHLPSRDYLLLTGPVSAAADIDWGTFDDVPDPQSPNLFWPADHAWCVASEIDFDSTLVGGSASLIADLLAAPGLEAWPVSADDRLTFAADAINT